MSIHTLSARALLDGLSSGELSSVQIVDALLARHDQVDGQIHALVHVFRESALAEAAERDRERAAGQLRGPLHGLPITVKENLATAGLPVTLGLHAWADRVAERDAAIVATARDAGAIVLGKSNLPVALLSMETENERWGPTHNPWRLDRVPGGSSGGEAAAIASGQSPLGLATDIGGSIRIPAAWTGLCGLKPTAGRWSTLGQTASLPGQEAIRSTPGVMARTVGDLVLAMQALSGERQRVHDSRVPPLPVPDPSKVDVSRLRVGFYEDDGFFSPAASVRRATREAAEVLRAAGVDVVPYEAPNTAELVETYFAALSADGGRGLKEALGTSNVHPLLGPLLAMARIPPLGRRGLAHLARARGERRLGLLLDVFGEKTVTEFWRLCARRTRLQAEEMAAWRKVGIDAVICPPVVTPAALPRQTADWSMGAWQTMRQNLLDLPAGVQPVSLVRPDEQDRPSPADRLERRAASFEAGSAGLPLGVQLVGRPWEEDVVLALMSVLEAALRDRPDFPRTPVDPPSLPASRP